MASRCYRGKTRCTEFTGYPDGSENAKATVIHPPEATLPPPPLPFFTAPFFRIVSLCTYRAVYITERAEIWIILSCDCPRGDPIKIRSSFPNDERLRENGELRISFEGERWGIIARIFFAESKTARSVAPSSKFTVSSRRWSGAGISSETLCTWNEFAFTLRRIYSYPIATRSCNMIKPCRPPRIISNTFSWTIFEATLRCGSAIREIRFERAARELLSRRLVPFVYLRGSSASTHYSAVFLYRARYKGSFPCSRARGLERQPTRGNGIAVVH